MLDVVAPCMCEFRPAFFLHSARSCDRHRVKEQRNVVGCDRHQPDAEHDLPVGQVRLLAEGHNKGYQSQRKGQDDAKRILCHHDPRAEPYLRQRASALRSTVILLDLP
jgi:hypothetical protein